MARRLTVLELAVALDPNATLAMSLLADKIIEQAHALHDMPPGTPIMIHAAVGGPTRSLTLCKRLIEAEADAGAKATYLKNTKHVVSLADASDGDCKCGQPHSELRVSIVGRTE